ncbi:MAG TPA: hypothetical protein VGQ55_12160 [Pyrinomonadaceae bacterium]|jgi:hypothetical protein|nr:hypothetical protein [Pyrinomonadaceae bacterium]
MNKNNLVGMSLALIAILFVGLSCSQVKDIAEKAANEANKEAANRANAANTSNTAATNSTDTKTDTGRIVNPDDKAEFTFTAEEIYKIYDKDSDADDKYKDKVVAVKGRFMEIETDKKDTNDGYAARLKAGGTFDWVNCSVDEGEKEAFMKLKEDQMVTVKGLGEDFWIGGPRFKHCVISSN